MILADTSVWIRHFRENNSELAALLTTGQVATHPFIVGELACGNLPKSTQTLHDFDCLPTVKMCLEKEVRRFIESHALPGMGIGYIDAHLLASALVSDIPLWTLDKRLAEIADKLDCTNTS